jgi:antirestriction protein ArdC
LAIFSEIGRSLSRYCEQRGKIVPTVPEIVTENVIKQLEQGVAPWRKPWPTSVPRNLISKKAYRGLNVFMLATQGYGSCYWLTFNQAKQLGAHVRQGEKSTLVSFWKFNEYARENGKTGELENKTSVLLRYYRVFNVEQCDGLKALYGDDRKPVNPIAECESIADRMPNPPRIEQHSQAFCAWATRLDDRGVQPPEMIFNNR